MPITTTHHAFDWHDEKSAACLSTRGFDFIYAARIFLGGVIEREDIRKDYGETRIQAVGMIEGSRYMVVYTRRGDVTWIISARRMHDKEWKKWQG